MSMWDAGRYENLAERLVPAALVLTQWAGPGELRAALDVAAGDGRGAAALMAARWQVTALDSSPRLVGLGRDRTGPRVVWHEADFHHMPVPSDSQELVVSSFGLIFATDPAAVLGEVSRVLRPGGRLLYTAWTRSGVMGEMTTRMAATLPQPPAGAPDGFAWAEPNFVASRVPTLHTARRETHHLPWTFSSPDAGVQELFTRSPAHLAAESMAGGAAPRLRAAVRDHLAEMADDTGWVNAQAEFVVIECSTDGA